MPSPPAIAPRITLPTAPLVAFLRRKLAEDPHLADVASGEVTVAMMAREMGVTFRRAAGVAYRARIAHASADLYATRLGVHPSAIWGDDYYRLTEVDGHPYVDPNDPKEE